MSAYSGYLTFEVSDEVYLSSIGEELANLGITSKLDSDIELEVNNDNVRYILDLLNRLMSNKYISRYKGQSIRGILVDIFIDRVGYNGSYKVDLAMRGELLDKEYMEVLKEIGSLDSAALSKNIIMIYTVSNHRGFVRLLDDLLSENIIDSISHMRMSRDIERFKKQLRDF